MHEYTLIYCPEEALLHSVLPNIGVNSKLEVSDSRR